MTALIWAETPEQNAVFAAWVAARIPHMDGGDFGACRAAVVMASDGTPTAGVVFHEYQPTYNTMQVSIAADAKGWARRDVLRAMFAYAFRQVGVDLLWAVMPAALPDVLKFNGDLGFKREAVLRHRFGWKRHAIVASMTKGEWRNTPWFVKETD